MDMLQPNVVIPMHFRSDGRGFDVLSTEESFTGLFDHVNHCGDTFVLTEDAPRQVLVMEQKNRHK